MRAWATPPSNVGDSLAKRSGIKTAHQRRLSCGCAHQRVRHLAEYQRAGRAGRLRASWAQTACRPQVWQTQACGSKIATVCTTGRPCHHAGKSHAGVVAKAGLAAIAFVVTAWSKATIFPRCKALTATGSRTARPAKPPPKPPRSLPPRSLPPRAAPPNGDHATRSHDLQTARAATATKIATRRLGSAVQAPDLESLPT